MKNNDQVRLIISSFSRLLGRDLIDPNQTLFNAPFAVLSHGTESDPVFNYGNQTALDLFEVEWDDFVKLPSRFSAEEQNRDERERLLARVTEFGYIDDYRGVRISSTGKRFLVEDAIVWNMIDEQGVYRGQAAVLYKWSTL